MTPAQRLERLRAARLHLQRAASDVDGLVRDSLALHSTDYVTPYLSAHARVPDVDPAALFRRLRTGDGLVRLNAFRNTVHVVCVGDLPLVLAATGAAVAQVGRKQPGLASLPEGALDDGVAALVDALASGPKTTEELKAALPGQAADSRWWLLLAMGRGAVIRADAVNPRTNRCRYAAIRSWVPGFRPDERPIAEVRAEVLRRAVRTFGPLTVEDLAWWLPAPKSEVKRALAGAAGLATLEVEGATYWFSEDLALVDAPPREEHGVWLLPYEDAFLKSAIDRSAWFAPGLLPVVFARHPSHWRPPDGVDPGPGPHGGVNTSGEARPSIWWRGRVVGRWEQDGDRVVWQLHAPVDAAGRRAVEAAVAETERFLGALDGSVP